MKRFEEKVKDLVDIRAFPHGQDYLSDPSAAISEYRFTDITSDLVVKWLDAVAHTRSGEGTALALAGFRGVGKSHFLAVLAAILANPELRSRIQDEHVQSSVVRLSRRAYTIVHVRRGTGSSLVDELRSATATALAQSPNVLHDDVNELLVFATQQSDLPLVIIVDTAAGRESRIHRDDGAKLAEISDAARMLGIFLGVALDDDIAGADGVNAAIATGFAIDYLDQEHLYRIVDRHLFVKHRSKQGLLHEIYTDLRESLNGFNWSEQRFAALYPLHPACFDLAPVVRLYLQDFSLLGFASQAGQKMLARPANSLIGLDTLYEAVENRLRGIDELKLAFATCDTLEQEVIEKAPFNVRLQSKLVLRALFLLSLRERPATAAEIAASMMLCDEADRIEDIVEGFAAVAGESPLAKASVGSEKGYLLKIGGEVGAGSALDEAAAGVDEPRVRELLLRHMAERFSDVRSVDSGHVPCTVEWRGGLRRGEIVFGALSGEHDSRQLDWRVLVDTTGEQEMNDGPGVFRWCTAGLTADESATLRRAYALALDPELAGPSDRAAATAKHVHAMAVERIWRRVFIDDAVVRAPGLEISFYDDADSSHTLSELLTRVLILAFEAQHPKHPLFERQVAPEQVSDLVTNFFGGHDPKNSHTQLLAAQIARPLGLASPSPTGLVPTTADELRHLGLLRALLGTDERPKRVETAAIEERNRGSEFGLCREALHLVLAALVAQKSFEFVTSDDNRINYRSLDLQLIWDDIVGIAPPSTDAVSTKELREWVELVAGVKVNSFDRPEDIAAIKSGLGDCRNAWPVDEITGRIEKLGPEELNVSLWRSYQLVQMFSDTTETIDRIRSNEIEIVEGLRSIAELFSHSEEEFRRRWEELPKVRDMLAFVEEFRRIERYLILAETTEDENVELARSEALDAFAADRVAFDDPDEFLEKCAAFRARYADHLTARHDQVLATYENKEALREFRDSDVWASFEMCSQISIFPKDAVDSIRARIAEIDNVDCKFDTRRLLESNPYCECGFRLDGARTLGDVLDQTREQLASLLEAFRNTVVIDGDTLIAAARSEGSVVAANVEALVIKLSDTSDGPLVTPDEVIALGRAYALIHNDSACTADESMANVLVEAVA